MVPSAVMERTVIYLVLPCWLGYEVGRYKSCHRVGWGKRYKKDKKERNITAAVFSLQPELCIHGIYPFLQSLLAIVVLSN